MAYGEGQWVAVWSCLKDMPGINPILAGSGSTGSLSSSSSGAGKEPPRTLKFIILQRSSQTCVVLNALEDGYSILSVASSPAYTLVALIKVRGCCCYVAGYDEVHALELSPNDFLGPNIKSQNLGFDAKRNRIPNQVEDSIRWIQ